MRLTFVCMDCAKANRSPAWSTSLPIADDGIYRFKCDDGHNQTHISGNHKFQELYELALNAILDGYYRDAILSFQGALEKFYEFFVMTVWTDRLGAALDSNKAYESINRAERQLGAFNAVYPLVKGAPAPQFSNGWTKVRNKVTHDGRIPSRVQAEEYGEAVRCFIVPLIEDLKTLDRRAIMAMRLHTGLGRFKEANMPEDMHVRIGGGVLAVTYDDKLVPETVEQALGRMKLEREGFAAPRF